MQVTVMKNFRLPPALAERLRTRARLAERSEASLVVEILDEGLRRRERQDPRGKGGEVAGRGPE